MPSSLFAKREACFAHRSSDYQRAPIDARRELCSAISSQIGGANIGKLVPSSLFAKREACFAHRSSDYQRAPIDARRELKSLLARRRCLSRL